ncbi:SEL1-like repeat protein [Candidatus Paracaedibacter symbiosus]|uniref:SEL1-like repeat protein n=1 Tax=Candidatus Paracaedibacter symbiosus TaxID=244582 RepID=UPI0012EB4C0C|nr:SEL1-like repeat protein [Candidatus Paracaedibacter symbiosus]
MEKDDSPQIHIDHSQALSQRSNENGFLKKLEDLKGSRKRAHQHAFSTSGEEGHVEHLNNPQDTSVINTEGEEISEEVSSISTISCVPPFEAYSEYERKVSEEKDELIGQKIIRLGGHIGRKREIWEEDKSIKDKETPVGLMVHNFSQILYRDATQERNIPLENEDIILSDVLGTLHTLAGEILSLGIPLEKEESEVLFGNIPNILAARISFILKRGRGQARYIPAGYLWLSDEDEPEPGNSVTVLTSGSRQRVYPFLTLEGLEGYYHRYKDHYSRNELPTIRLDAAGDHTEQGLIKRLMGLKEKRDVIQEKLNKAIENYANLEDISSGESCFPSKKLKEPTSEEALILYLVSGREICSNQKKELEPTYFHSCYYDLIERLSPYLAKYIPNVILCFSYNNSLGDKSIISSSTKRNYYLHSITNLEKSRPIVCRHAKWGVSRLRKDVTILPPQEGDNTSFKRYQLLIKLKKGVEEFSYPCLSLEELRIIKDDFKMYSKDSYLDDFLKYHKNSSFLSYLSSLGNQGNIHAQYLAAKGYFASGSLSEAKEKFRSIYRLHDWDRRNEDVMERNIVSKHENIIKWSLEWYEYHAGKYWLSLSFVDNKKEQKEYRNIVIDYLELRLGNSYEYGWGTQKNLHKAEKCYKRACEEADNKGRKKNLRGGWRE